MDWNGLFPDLILSVTNKPINDTICRIEYEEEYKQAIQLLDAIITNGEHSPRVLTLTDYIVNQCEGHYTAWSLRRLCLTTASELESEREWISRYTADCPKNYQLWQHRMHGFLKITMLGSTGSGSYKSMV